jgi:Protein of unknown function (DUF 659)/hAT family C-terminal dimerisation region
MARTRPLELDDDVELVVNPATKELTGTRAQFTFSFFVNVVENGQTKKCCQYRSASQKRVDGDGRPTICGKKYVTEKSDGLIRHLRSHNDREINQKLDRFTEQIAMAAKKRRADEEIILPSKRSRPLDSFVTILPVVERAAQDSLEVTALCFAVDDLSMNLASSHYFKLMLESYHKARSSGALKKPHSLKSIDDQQQKSFVDMQRVVNSHLKSASQDYPASILFDGWQNVNHIHVQNILVSCQGVNFFMKSDVSATGRSTAAVLFGMLKPVLINLITEGVVVSSMVADNASVNGAIFDLAAEEFPFLIAIPCAAHTLQLCVARLFNDDSLADNLRAVTYRVHRRITYSQPRLARFRASQSKPIHNLHKPQKTRWSSFYQAFTSLLRTRAAVMNVLDNDPLKLKLTEEFWSDLKSFVDFLAPFRDATNIVQSDRAGLLDVSYQFRALANQMRTAPPRLANAAAVMRRALRRNWTKHVHERAVFMSEKFAFENIEDSLASDEVKSAAPRWFLDWSARFLHQFKYSQMSVDELRRILQVQYNEFVRRHGPFADLRGQLELLAEESATDARLQAALSRAGRIPKFSQVDVLTAWRHVQDLRPQLSFCVITLLSINCSEAAVERSFSHQKLTHSLLKNRKLPFTVERQMCLKLNENALKLAKNRGISVAKPFNAADVTDASSAIDDNDDDDAADEGESDTDVEIFDSDEAGSSSNDSDREASDTEASDPDVHEADRVDSPQQQRIQRRPVLNSVRRRWTIVEAVNGDLDEFCRWYINTNGLTLPAPFSRRGAAKLLRTTMEAADATIRIQQPDVAQSHIMRLLLEASSRESSEQSEEKKDEGA